MSMTVVDNVESTFAMIPPLTLRPSRFPTSASFKLHVLILFALYHAVNIGISPLITLCVPSPPSHLLQSTFGDLKNTKQVRLNRLDVFDRCYS